MEEKIYTIPVNEAFEQADGCPFCRLRRKLDADELDLILGASMMDPDIRIKTNKLGFCKKHFDKMFTMKNRLGLGLMLESHLAEITDKTTIWKNSLIGKDNTKKAAENIRELKKSCYICERTNGKFEKMLFCAIILWAGGKEFKEKLTSQPYFCFEHAEEILETARVKLDKKSFAAFAESLAAVQNNYMESLKADVSWFCKKFDYRYDEEPWGNAKDSVERAIKLLGSDY